VTDADLSELARSDRDTEVALMGDYADELRARRTGRR
jgi:hypothetical protein